MSELQIYLDSVRGTNNTYDQSILHKFAIGKRLAAKERRRQLELTAIYKVCFKEIIKDKTWRINRTPKLIQEIERNV